MHSLSKLVFSVAGGLLVAYQLGCTEPQVQLEGTGGSTVTDTGGSGGTGAGGTTESGGQSGSGGTSETGGTVGAGGAAGSGGTTEAGGATGAGGETAAGGTTSGTGGRTGPGGRTGSGGASAAGGTTSGTGGRTSGTGGGTGSGGSTGSGGRTSAGGTTGGAGSTGGPPPVTKKFFGNIDTSGSIRSDFASMWDQFSPENAGKWGSVQGGGQTSFNWGSLDKMYKYCTDNNIIFKEHCFIWGAQQPSWVNSSNAETAVKAWMKAFCERYPATAIIDVVNEPLHPQPSYKEGIGGAGSSGYDWIANAVKWAREACPNAILVVNDYNTIEYSSENGRIITLVNAIKKAGAPIDAVGAQAHDIAKVSQSTMTSYGEKIINDTGLPLHITEMDIGIADDNQQATKMKDFVTWAWNNPKVSGLTYWGYIVGRTWRSNTGLMTDSGTKRAALTWLLSFLGR